MRSLTSTEDCRGLDSLLTQPLKGYIDPCDPAHQNSASTDVFAALATASAAHAPCAMGLAKMTASGFRMEVRALSPHVGSISDRYPISRSPPCRHPREVMMLSQYVSGYLYQCTW